MLLEEMEIQLSSPLAHSLGRCVVIEVREVVHFEEVIEIHFSAGVAASVDFVELLRERSGSIRGQEYATERCV